MTQKLDRGIELFNSGAYAEAATIFEECLAAGEDASAFLQHARDALSGKALQPPKDVVDVFVAVAEGDPAALSAAARRLFNRDKAAGARVMRDIWVAKKDRRFESRPAAASRSPWALFLRASLAWDAGKNEEALALVRSAARSQSWMRYYVAEILTRRLDRFEEALKEIEKTEKAAPWLWEASFLRAELRWTLGARPGDVIAPLEKINPPASHVPSMLSWRGAIKMWLGRAKEALKDLDAAAAAAHHDASCWRGGARALLGDLEGALSDLNELLARDPDDPEALVWRGEVLRRLGRRTEARRDLERAIHLSDASVWAWVNLALLDLDENRVESALECRARLLPPQTLAPAPDPDRLRQELESALSAAGGVRRSDTHLNRAWLIAAGAHPSMNPSPDERLRAWFERSTSGRPA